MIGSLPLAPAGGSGLGMVPGKERIQSMKQKLNAHTPGPQLATTTKKTRARIIVFQESDGFHWDLKSSVDESGYIDARGPGYPTRRKAMQAAKRFLARGEA